MEVIYVISEISTNGIMLGYIQKNEDNTHMINHAYYSKYWFPVFIKYAKLVFFSKRNYIMYRTKANVKK